MRIKFSTRFKSDLNKYIVKESSYKIDYLSLVMGILSTMPIVGIHVAGRTLALSSLAIFICMCMWFYGFSIKRLHMGVTTAFFYSCILSSLYGISFFSLFPEFSDTAKSYIPRIIVYLILGLLLSGQQKKESISCSIIKGIVIGSYINCVWSILDAGSYYVSGKSLTNSLFSDYISLHSIRYGQLSLIRNGAIRSGGLNGDPANMGFYACIIGLYWYASRAKSIVPILISVGALFASSSVTGVVGMLLGLLVVNATQKRGKISSGFVVALCIAAIVIFEYLTHESTITDVLINRLNSHITDGSSSIRAEYYMQTIPAILNASPIRMLIGTGFSTSSYSLFSTGSLQILFAEQFRPYDPESVYISYLFDIGLIGLAIYLYILFKTYSVLRKRHDKVALSLNSIVLTTLLVGLFYHYTLYLPIMLALICSEHIVKSSDVEESCPSIERLDSKSIGN